MIPIDKAIENLQNIIDMAVRKGLFDGGRSAINAQLSLDTVIEQLKIAGEPAKRGVGK